jgi:hypothetical protein
VVGSPHPAEAGAGEVAFRTRHQQQQQQQQQPEQSEAAAAPVDAAEPVQYIRVGTFAELIVPVQQQQQQQEVLQNSRVNSGVNYKAFRRKGQQPQQQQQSGRAAPVWELVPIARDLQGTDTDAFLK